MKKRIEIYSCIAGIIFLISGIAKSINISAFARIITQYGFENLYFLAIFIVLAETFIGLMLVFQIYLKETSLIGILLLLLFTIVYAYGLIFKEIEDCGCFGNITVLNTSPFFIFLRNIVLLYLLITIWQKGNSKNLAYKWIALTMLMFMCLVAFMSGFSYQNFNKNIYLTNKYEVKHLRDTALNEFLSTNKDSTYLVFAFTYTCPHCLNSIENLKQYEKSNIVDKVIGFAIGDSIAEQQFVKIFKPDFLINNIEPKSLFRLTNTFPTAYYIKNDSVITELSGELPCSFIFEKIINHP